MPAEGLAWQPREEHLTDDEIVRLAAVFAQLGVRALRLTGGEPLLRRGLPQLVARLRAIPGIEDLALTTNGVLLATQAADLAAAGGVRLNVSLDSTDRDVFARVTRRDDLERVLASVRAAAEHPELRPIKLNAVALRGVAEDALDGLLALAATIDAELRFIEPMPLDAGHSWQPSDVLSGARLRELLAERGPLEQLPAPPSSTARRYRVGGQVVGLISSVTEPFCGACDRVRLTADGQLRSCLFSHDEADLRGLLRGGASDAELARAIQAGVWEKPRGHGISDPGFEPPQRPMSAIGG